MWGIWSSCNFSYSFNWDQKVYKLKSRSIFSIACKIPYHHSKVKDFKEDSWCFVYPSWFYTQYFQCSVDSIYQLFFKLPDTGISYRFICFFSHGPVSVMICLCTFHSEPFAFSAVCWIVKTSISTVNKCNNDVFRI